MSVEIYISARRPFSFFSRASFHVWFSQDSIAYNTTNTKAFDLCNISSQGVCCCIFAEIQEKEMAIVEGSEKLRERGLPPDARVCSCSTCSQHVGQFKNSQYCGTQFLLNREGTEYVRCRAANCGVCGIRCEDCRATICRECDLCEWCDEFLCHNCIPRKHCQDCNKAFCETKVCSVPFEECRRCKKNLSVVHTGENCVGRLPAEAVADRGVARVNK